MKDNFKDFISNHREEFDDQLPPELWSSISAGIKQPSPSMINLKKLGNMFKYGFGASALIIGTFFIFQSLKSPQLSDRSNEAKLPQFNISTIALKDSETKKPMVKVALVSGKTTTDKSKPTNKRSVKSMNAKVTQGMASSSFEQSAIPNRPLLSGSMISHPARTSNPDSVSVSNLDSNSAYAMDTVFSGVKNLIVKGNYCAINISGNEREDVSLKGNVSREYGQIITTTNANKKISKQNTRQKIKYSLHKSTLTVWIETEVLTKNNKAENKVKGEQGLHFEVPVNTHVEVEDNYGDIQVSGINDAKLKISSSTGHIRADNLVGDVNINSTSGDVILNNISGHVNTVSSFGKQSLVKINGDIKLVSKSGDITIKHLQGNADVTSSFGFQKFENVSGNINSSASSGDLEIENLTGNLITKTSFGNQDLDNVIGNITADASSGNIQLEKATGTLILSTTFGNIHGTGIKLLSNSNFTTSSGDITMEFLNDISELSFDLTSSSGDLQVKKGSVELNSEKKLAFDKGPIKIKGVSGFGNQKYK